MERVAFSMVRELSQIRQLDGPSRLADGGCLILHGACFAKDGTPLVDSEGCVVLDLEGVRRLLLLGFLAFAVVQFLSLHLFDTDRAWELARVSPLVAA